jgi:hypothetical protein
MNYQKMQTALRLREYGRNIQLMAERMNQEADPKRKERMAHEIIRVMSTLVPANREMAEYKKKLWDHLNRLTNYQLDIPTPFPLSPPPQDRAHKRIDYYTPTTRYKQYGKNLEIMIEKIGEIEDGPLQAKLTLQVLAIMKQFLQQYGASVPNEQTMLEQIHQISGGKIQYTLEELQPYINAWRPSSNVYDLDKLKNKNYNKDKRKEHSENKERPKNKKKKNSHPTPHRVS